MHKYCRSPFYVYISFAFSCLWVYFLGEIFWWQIQKTFKLLVFPWCISERRLLSLENAQKLMENISWTHRFLWQIDLLLLLQLLCNKTDCCKKTVFWPVWHMNDTEEEKLSRFRIPLFHQIHSLFYWNVSRKPTQVFGGLTFWIIQKMYRLIKEKHKQQNYSFVLSMLCVGPNISTQLSYDECRWPDMSYN